MHRLFLGSPVSAEAARQLTTWSEANMTDLRTVPAHSLHVTILFFGAVDGEKRVRLSLSRFR